MTTQEFNDDELVDEYSKNYNDDNIPLSQNMQRHARIYGVEKTSPALLMKWARRARKLEQRPDLPDSESAMAAHPHPGYCVRWGVENGMDGRRFRQPAFAEAIRQASVLAEALALMCQPAPWFVQVEGRGRILFEVKGYPGA